MRWWRARARRDGGFTLIELIVVMTIITILAGAVSLQIVHKIENAKRARALQDVKTIETAVELYQADNGSAPTTQQGIAALRSKPSAPPVPRNWDGPYLKKAAVDPWGNDYIYRSPGQINPTGFDIISYAKDEKPGGEGADADITNSDEE